MTAPCRGCAGLDRREFLERTLALLGVSALAACGAGATSAPGITAFTIRIADYPALAATGGIAVLASSLSNGEPIAVARTGDAAFVALSLVCPHRGFTVQPSGAGFYCPGHGATFSTNGTWTGGQPTSNLAAYHLAYDATAGTLTIS